MCHSHSLSLAKTEVRRPSTDDPSTYISSGGIQYQLGREWSNVTQQSDVLSAAIKVTASQVLITQSETPIRTYTRQTRSPTSRPTFLVPESVPQPKRQIQVHIPEAKQPTV